MNTVEKGDAFEKATFTFFQQCIEAGQFWARKECCQIFYKKGYYSKDRGAKIVFDVSIEINLPGESQYSVLVLIECKNYSGSVPVNEIEEFWSKIQQVAGVNVKGIFASTNAFQRSTRTYAKSKKFGLLRFFKDQHFKWVLTRTPSTFSGSSFFVPEAELRAAISEEAFVSTYYSWCGLVDGVHSSSIYRVFEQLFIDSNLTVNSRSFAGLRNPPSETREVVKFRRKEEIEALASESLDQIGYREGIVDLDRVCAWQKQVCGLTVEIKANSPYVRRILALGHYHSCHLELLCFKAVVSAENVCVLLLPMRLGTLFWDTSNICCVSM